MTALFRKLLKPFSRDASAVGQKNVDKGAIGGLVFLTLGLKIAGAGLGFLVNIVLARTMGADGFGMYLIAFTTASIVAVFASAGITFSAIRFVPQYVVKEDWSAVRGFFRLGNFYTITGSIFVLVAGLSLLHALRDEYDPVLWQSLVIAAFAVPVISAVQTVVAYLQSLGKILASEMASNIVRPLATMLPVLCIYFISGRTVLPQETLIVASMAAALVLAITCILFVKARPPQSLEVKPSYQVRLWVSSGVSMLFILTASILNERIDIVMVGALLGAEPTGVYGAASRSALSIGLALSAVNVFLMRQLSAAYAEHDNGKLKTLAVFGAWLAFGLSILIGGTLILLSQFILGLFGPDFLAGDSALKLLVVSQWALAAFGASGGLVVVAGGQRIAMAAMLAGLLGNLCLNYFLVPIYGLAGAASATLVSILISQAILAGWCWIKLGFNPSIFGGWPWRAGQLPAKP